MVVESRLQPVRFEGDDIPSGAGTERGPQILLTYGMRAYTGTIVAEAQHIQGSSVLGHRRQTRHVNRPLIAIASVKQSAVQHRLKRPPQTLEVERVRRSELDLDATVAGLLSGHGQRRLSHVDAQNR